MKRFIIVLALWAFMIMPALASTDNYPNPDRQTMWNNITDGMHTIGKNPVQARQIKKRLHNTRKQTRQRDIKNAQEQAWMQSHQQQ